MKFSQRMDYFGAGIFTQLLALKNQRLAQGKPVIDLSVGNPNIPPAPHIMRAISDACLQPENYKYALKDTPALAEAAAVWYQRRYGVTLDPDTEVCSVLGSQEGLSHFAMTVVDEGELLLVPDPCYPVFADGGKLAGGNVHYMPQRPENGYIIDLNEIPVAVAQQAKYMVVSYPNNPTTAMAPDSFYEALIAFAKEYDIIVLHDNAYSDLTFDGQVCGSFLRFPGAKDVGVEFNSLSKTYGMAGARVGFCVGNAAVVGQLKNLKSNIDYGMFHPIQQGAIAAITGDQSSVAETCNAYQARRDVLCASFAQVGWSIPLCPSTMFVWAKIPAHYTSSVQFALDMAERAGVLVTPGSAFGPSGEGHVRLALVQDADAIRQAAAYIQDSGILQG